MPVESKFEKVADDDPSRCQSVTGKGQCQYKSLTGSSYCAMHGGNKAQEALGKESLRNYRLAKWQNRVNEKADSSGVKSLREEIGILRICLEEIVSRCGDPTELIINSAKISDLVMKIEKIVTSCHRLESNLGMMLDKQAAMQLSGEIVDIIAKYVTNDDTVAAIANDIGIVLARVGSSKLDPSS